MSYLEELFSMEGKLAVVTGGSRGLGRGMAEALLGAGAEVILVSADERRLESTVSELAASGLKAMSYQCDLASATEIDGLCAFLEQEHGRLDILVNAAGVTKGWDDVTEYAPAVITAIAMPFTFSIATGIGIGFIAYVVIKILSGKFSEASPAMVVIAAAFVAKFWIG